MTERERLIELLKEIYPKTRYIPMEECREKTADFLIANGVIVPPCKVGDTVYKISKRNGFGRYIQKTEVSRIAINDEGFSIFCKCNPISKCVFYKNVFLTKEEAEAALQERDK